MTNTQIVAFRYNCNGNLVFLFKNIIMNNYVKLAFQTISIYYGDQVAKRSQVPLINHIVEGLSVLDIIGADIETKAAYCLHPMLQSDENFIQNKSNIIPQGLIDAAILAMDYRRVANSYLSKDKVTDFVGFSCVQIKNMLIADKVQNYKDFLKYHKLTHERSKELDEYFNNWFELLEINYHDIIERLELYLSPR